ncbi:MAG: PfkB family carbohydrate kinase [Pseudomonadota bacterium]
MTMRNYDIFVFGNMSIGVIKTPDEEYIEPGGPIIFAVWTAHQLGHSVGLLTKTSFTDQFRLKEFPVADEDLFWRESSETTSNRVVYQTASMETRVLTNLKQADHYRTVDFPDISAKVIQFSGVLAGEIDLEMIRYISKKAPTAVDAQGMMRKVLPNRAVEYADWKDKREAMALITYFKADAAEAAFLTGIQTDDYEGRVAAAKTFLEWGAKEVVVSHHTGLIAARASEVVFSPFKSRNLSGRTGRGDTSFTTYITERFTKEPADAIKFSTALTSLKMEVPGPFKKTREEVEAFMRAFY